MTKAEQQHKARLVLMGCVACRRIHGPHEAGSVELHHLRTGGWGKGGYLTLIPLCFEHHRGALGVHGLGTKLFDKYYGDAALFLRPFTQQTLLDDALQGAK